MCCESSVVGGGDGNEDRAGGDGQSDGDICTVETRARWVGEKGLHMEDLVQVTDGAPVLLSDFFDNEDILVI